VPHCAALTLFNRKVDLSTCFGCPNGITFEHLLQAQNFSTYNEFGMIMKPASPAIQNRNATAGSMSGI